MVDIDDIDTLFIPEVARGRTLHDLKLVYGDDLANLKDKSDEELTNIVKKYYDKVADIMRKDEEYAKLSGISTKKIDEILTEDSGKQYNIVCVLVKEIRNKYHN